MNAGVAGVNAGKAAASVGAAASGFNPGAARTPSSPRIVVTNWWTGAYRVDDGSASQTADVSNASAGVGVSAGDPEARAFRKQAASFRDQAQYWHEQVRSGSMSARKAAKEQIRAARQRAQEMRARAAAHRSRVAVGRHSSASPWLFAMGFVTLLLLVGGLVIGFSSLRARPAYSRTTVNGNSTTTVTSSALMLPVLLIVEGADPANPKVKQRLDRIIAERRADNYDVITDLADDANLRMLIDQWWHDQSGPADEQLENIMQARNAYGILHVTFKGDAKRPVKDVQEQLVRSTREDASSRRRISVQTIVPAGPAPRLPYLLINDHPAKIDPKVETVVQAAIDAYKARGWKIDANDDVEVEVRKLLPPGKVEAANTLPPMLRDVLERRGFGGVLRIDAMGGEGEPQERVIVTIVNADDIRSPDAPLPEPGDVGDAPNPPEILEAPEAAQTGPVQSN